MAGRRNSSWSLDSFDYGKWIIVVVLLLSPLLQSSVFSWFVLCQDPFLRLHICVAKQHEKRGILFGVGGIHAGDKAGGRSGIHIHKALCRQRQEKSHEVPETSEAPGIPHHHLLRRYVSIFPLTLSPHVDLRLA